MKITAANPLATSISLLLVIGLMGCGSDQPEVTATQSQETVAEPIQRDELKTEPDLIAESLIDVPELISEEEDGTSEDAGESVDQSLETMLSELNESESASSESITGTRERVRERERSGWQEEESESPVSESITDAQSLTATTEQQIEEPEDLSEVVAATPELIRKVQQALANAGFKPGAIDGIKGPRTMSALNDFQRQNNLAMGQLTKETLQKLDIPY